MHGVVLGCLLSDGAIDTVTLCRFVQAAKSAPAANTLPLRSNLPIPSNFAPRPGVPAADDSCAPATFAAAAAAVGTPSPPQPQPQVDHRTTVTFHRAFDVCSGDPLTDLALLGKCGVDFVLTSGRVSLYV